MKKVFTTGFIAGLVLLAISFLALQVMILVFPNLTDEYYSPAVISTSERLVLYFIHPFVMSITFAWFWNQFKSGIEGNWIYRGVWVGLIYGAVATLPAMWITFSSLNVTLTMAITWFIYGVFAAIVAGLIFAKLNP
jgi:hypothetical protein